MNRKFIFLSINLFFLFITFFVFSKETVFSACVGEATCEYQYELKKCVGGPNNGSVCTADVQCAGFPSGVCLPSGTYGTQTQTANCADLGASCTAGANPCVAPYILTSGSCQGAGGVCTPGQVVNQGCAANGCGAGTQRVCTCNAAGTAWTCTCDGNPACNPPPGQESCSSCSGSTCNTTQVPTGTCGGSNCNACSGTPPPTAPPAASCTVSLSPSSGTIDIALDSSLAFTANASAQNGSITQINFSSSNTSVAITSPTADGTAPYTTAVIPVKSGTTTLTASVIVNGSPTCSTTANITVNDSNPPSCDSFDATTPTVTQGANAHFVAEVTDVGANLIPDGSYESGGMSYWPYNNSTNEWYAVDSLVFPSAGIEGRYYAKLSRLTIGADSYATTDWHATGENLTGQTYTLEFLAKSHSAPSSVARISLQREPFGGDWAGTLTPEQTAAFTHTEWTKFRYDLTFPNPGNSSTTQRLRPVLRPAANLAPVYYDAVKVFKTSSSGVNPSTVRFYYMLATANPCVQANWTLIGVGTRIGVTNFYEINWNTTGIPNANYIVSVSASDIDGHVMSGNPVDCGVAGVNYEIACNATQTISACAATCGPDTGCGTLNHTPSAVSNITVTGIAGNNLNLSSNPLPRTISWTAATITAPATVSAYDVWLIPRGAAIPASTNACNFSGTCRILTWTSGTSVSLPTVLPEQTNNFDIVVRARTACGTAGTWTRRAVDLTADVSGNIYETATSPDGSNNCVGAGTPIDISLGNPSMTSSTGGSLAGAVTSSYSFTNVPYAPTSAWAPDYGFDLTLNIANPDPTDSFYCSCPGGSPTSCVQTDTTSPATNQNYFVTSIDLSNGPWWQTSQGNVYGTQGYTSDIPNTALTYLITQNAAGDTRSAGIPLSGGTVTAGTGWWTEYNGGTTQPRANATTHANTVREDYNYFVRDVDLDTITSLDETITEIPDASTGTQIEDVSAFKRTGDLSLDLSALQTVTGGRKIVFFVSGDVRINNSGAQNSQVISVDKGSYFAIIAGGNITFNNTIGNTCAYPTCTTTAPNIAGVYVASNQLIIADNALNPHTAADNMFVGEGTFVGWQGIELQRTFDNTTNPLDTALNNTYATELFLFRPDFTRNTPEIFLKPNLVWQEVN